MLDFGMSYVSWLGYREILRKSRSEIESQQQPHLEHKEPQQRGQSLRVLPLGSQALKYREACHLCFIFKTCEGMQSSPQAPCSGCAVLC